MKYSIILSTLSLASLAAALPSKRDGPTDIDGLNYALTLEHLEAAFYAQGLAKYTQQHFKDAGYPPWVRDRFKQIAAHEKTHVAFLTTAISATGAKAVEPCEYQFPDTDVKSFIDTSSNLETVGTSAYNGIAPLIKNKDYLGVGASILAVEARHAAWINSAARKLNPWSTAFETPLTPNQVYTLASGFIKSCPPTNPPIPVHGFPPLALVPSSLTPGGHVKPIFEAPKDKDQAQKPLYAAFITGTGTVFVPLDIKDAKDGKDGKDAKGGKKEYEVEVPKDLIGTVYVVITDDGGAVTDETMVAGPALVMVDFDSEGRVVGV